LSHISVDTARIGSRNDCGYGTNLDIDVVPKRLEVVISSCFSAFKTQLNRGYADLPSALLSKFHLHFTEKWLDPNFCKIKVTTRI